MRRLLGAVAASGHAAPSPRSPSGVIGKHEGTTVPFARLDVGEVFLANKLRQRLADR
jgi:hypothetical protein